MLNLPPDAWLIADTHFGHDNIIRYCERPSNHDELMLERWSSAVGADDVILHLGDLTFRSSKDANELWAKIAALPGQKLLLLGNHDRSRKITYMRAGFEVIDAPLSTYQSRSGVTRWQHGFFWQAPDGRTVLLSHWPDQGEQEWDVNIHGHIHNNGWANSLPELDYRNVSVEVTDFAPVRLADVLAGKAGEARLVSPRIDSWS